MRKINIQKTRNEMYRKIYLLFCILIFLVPTIKADIISVNSYGTGEVVLIPETLIEGFFFGQNITIIYGPGGGGTGRDPFLDEIDVFLCNETYYYILEHPDQPDYTGITGLINNIELRINYTYSWTLVRDYVDNWQYFCSDAINRTLMEGFVCDEVEDFLEENEYYTTVEIVELREELEQSISLSFSLVAFYIDNFEELCTIPGFPRFVSKVVQPYFIFWIILFLLVILLVASKNRIRSLVFLIKRRAK